MVTVSAENLRELLDYDPETGALTWKSRSLIWFNSERARSVWNSRYAGKPAFGKTNKEGYFRGSLLGKRYQAHRVAWAIHYGKWPEKQIDHINGDRADNRIANLRDVSRAQNQKNMRLSSANTSGVSGIYWCSNAKQWRAVITSDGKRHHLGYFHSMSEAISARKSAEKRHNFHPNHGETPCSI
jgi:hypothetical protein